MAWLILTNYSKYFKSLVGWEDLVWWSHHSKYSPIYIFSGDTFKIVIYIAKNEIQTFLYSVIFRGVLWTTFYTKSPWWLHGIHVFIGVQGNHSQVIKHTKSKHVIRFFESGSFLKDICVKLTKIHRISLVGISYNQAPSISER